MSKTSRKHLPGKDKIRMLKQHHLEKKPISDICDNEQVAPGSFYAWQKELFDRGAAVFDMGRRNRRETESLERTIAALKVKLAEKNEVIAELMQETIKLKKPIGEI